MNKKTGFRWRVRGFDVKSCEEFVNKCINDLYDVYILEGVLNDNYLIHDIVFEWFEWEKRHKVKFDYLFFMENNYSYEMIGFKERGMTEDEKKFIESFLEEYDEQEEEYRKQEEEWERWYNENKKENQKVVD